MSRGVLPNGSLPFNGPRVSAKRPPLRSVISVGGEPTARGAARITASRVGAESESGPATKKLEPIRFGRCSEGMWAVGVWQRH
jgi:hypothetical protein